MPEENLNNIDVAFDCSEMQSSEFPWETEASNRRVSVMSVVQEELTYLPQLHD